MADKISVLNIVIARWINLIPIIEVTDRDPICNILRHKLTWAVPEISNITPNHLIMYCSVCSGGNTGFAQVLLKDILYSNKETIQWCVMNNQFITPDIINKTKINGNHPTVDNKDAYDKYMKIWDRQKTNIGNKCDAIGYWTEILN